MYILFDIAEINKSSYYKWLSTSQQRRNKEDEENQIVEAIKELYIEHKGRLGVERMTNELRKEKKINCNHKKYID